MILNNRERSATTRNYLQHHLTSHKWKKRSQLHPLPCHLLEDRVLRWLIRPFKLVQSRNSALQRSSAHPPTSNRNDSTARTAQNALSRYVPSARQLVSRGHAWLDAMMRFPTSPRRCCPSPPSTMFQDEAGQSGNKTTAGGSLPSLNNRPIDTLSEESFRSGHWFADYGTRTTFNYVV